MIRFTPIASALALCVGLASTAGATPFVVTGFTTDGGALDDPLTSFTTSEGELTVSSFATTDDLPGSATIISLPGSSTPATQNEALSDNRIDTGSLNASGAGVVFDFSAAPAAGDSLFIFFNAAPGPSDEQGFQAPNLVNALDSGGNVIGSVTVNENGVDADTGNPAPGGVDVITGDDVIFTGTLTNGAGELPGRTLAGLAVGIESFGVADPSTIAGITIFGEIAAFSSVGTFDTQAVGLASAAGVVPEPTSLVLLALGGVVTLGRRRG